MYCKHCGNKLEEESKFCTKCGKDSLIVENDIEGKSFGEGKKKKEPHQRWSWGALGFGWIYFAAMRYKYYGWLFVLFAIVNSSMKSDDVTASAIGLVLWLVLVVTLGIKGRAIAWESRKWSSKEDFIKTQKVWDIWGAIVFVVFQTLFLIIPTT